MGLKIDLINLEKIENHNDLRFDQKYFSYIKIIEKNNEKFKMIRVKDVIKRYFKGFAFKASEFSENGNIPIVKGVMFQKNFSIDYNECSYLKNEETLENYKSFVIPNGTILISLVGSIGKISLYEENDNQALLNQNNIALELNLEVVNPKLFLYLIRKELQIITDHLYKNNGYSFLNIVDLFDIKIPDVSLEKQNKIVDLIMPIENEIDILYSSQESETDIINEVLVEELGFNLDEFNSIKKKGVYSTSLFDFSENVDLRFSSKFHNPSHSYMHDFLIQKTNKRVKDFVSEPIVLGKSVSPSEYEKDGECYYMSMATIKSWYFDSSESKSVSMDYERSNQNKKVAINDIVIARSGEGSIGKVALIDDIDINAVFADFTMRIRLENYNHKFAYYYFRSLFFQHLVEHNKKGLGNNTNIFPSQIQEFPMLDFSLEQQQKIVDKIKTRIDEQQKYTLQIEEKRAEIEKIILETLTF